MFDIIATYKFKKILINDINKDLINTYKAIQRNVDELIEILMGIQTDFLVGNELKRKKFYYEKRDKFNDIKINGHKIVDIEKAALFIFLNKTCFNGLYRVNSKSLYNVPMGTYKNPLICDKKNLKASSVALKSVVIKCGDFETCKAFINANTFVYIDPPYRPLTRTAKFTSYTENEFSDKEQIRLGGFIQAMHQIGSYVVLSNSDPKNHDENDTFFDDLYKNFSISRVNAKRMINSNSLKRGNINELLITNNHKESGVL